MQKSVRVFHKAGKQGKTEEETKIPYQYNACTYVCILSLSCTSGMKKISSPREIFHGINFSFVALELTGSRRGWEGTDEAM